MGIFDRLIARAKRTPYFHLSGYMNRWWLVPYANVIIREVADPLSPTGKTFLDDGTGPVTWRRPLARLLQLLDIAVRVHEILRSDSGRDPHNHPWPYLSVILRGGYTETTYNADGVVLDRRWHGPGSILYRPANSWHRLDLHSSAPCTTLFITGKKVQRWGFLTSKGFVPYDKYPGRNA